MQKNMNSWKRKIFEAMHVVQNLDSVNYKADCRNMSKFYAEMLYILNKFNNSSYFAFFYTP